MVHCDHLGNIQIGYYMSLDPIMTEVGRIIIVLDYYALPNE